MRAFLGKEKPRLTFDDGLEVVKMLMTAYKSAEQGKTLDFPPRGLASFVPAVARGRWNPRQLTGRGRKSRAKHAKTISAITAGTSQMVDQSWTP